MPLGSKGHSTKSRKPDDGRRRVMVAALTIKPPRAKK